MRGSSYKEIVSFLKNILCYRNYYLPLFKKSYLKNPKMLNFYSEGEENPRASLRILDTHHELNVMSALLDTYENHETVQCETNRAIKELLKNMEFYFAPGGILALSFYTGESITDYVKRPGRSNSDIRSVVCQLIKWVARLHEGLIAHRNLKQENILINGSGLVIVMGLSSSKWLRFSTTSLTGSNETFDSFDDEEENFIKEEDQLEEVSYQYMIEDWQGCASIIRAIGQSCENNPELHDILCEVSGRLEADLSGDPISLHSKVSSLYNLRLFEGFKDDKDTEVSEEDIPEIKQYGISWDSNEKWLSINPLQV